MSRMNTPAVSVDPSVPVGTVIVEWTETYKFKAEFIETTPDEAKEEALGVIGDVVQQLAQKQGIECSMPEISFTKVIPKFRPYSR